MSFHRVLPLLPALSDQALRDQWAIQPDTLISSKIMPDETNKAAANENKSPNPAPRSFSSPPEEGAQRSPGDESLEDYESPKHRTHSLSQVAGTGNRLSRADQSSVPKKSVVENWQDDSPSSICLCQPDPKVPRPRNGTSTIILHASLLLLPYMCFPRCHLIWFGLSSDIFSYSFYPLPPASPTGCCRPEPRSCKSRNL